MRYQVANVDIAAAAEMLKLQRKNDIYETTDNEEPTPSTHKIAPIHSH